MGGGWCVQATARGVVGHGRGGSAASPNPPHEHMHTRTDKRTHAAHLGGPLEEGEERRGVQAATPRCLVRDQLPPQQLWLQALAHLRERVGV